MRRALSELLRGDRSPGPLGTALFVAAPVVAAALLRREEDPLLVSLLVSAVYTYLNLRFEEIEDVHEEVFHALHTRHVLSAQAARPRPRARSGEIIG